MITLSVLIGNSDDKLSQKEWCSFVFQMDKVVEEFAEQIHFSSGSNSHARWQNFCWVFEIQEEKMASFSSEVIKVREFYNQDSVAVIAGDTKFI